LATSVAGPFLFESPVSHHGADERWPDFLSKKRLKQMLLKR